MLVDVVTTGAATVLHIAIPLLHPLTFAATITLGGMAVIVSIAAAATVLHAASVPLLRALAASDSTICASHCRSLLVPVLLLLPPLWLLQLPRVHRSLLVPVLLLLPALWLLQLP
jgi:hypothetical protein